MAKRRKTSKKAVPAKSSSLVQTAERAVIKQSNKMLVAATKRYNRFLRQAAKATNDVTKREYLAAALSAVVIAGVVANELRGRIAKRAATPAARKKRG